MYCWIVWLCITWRLSVESDWVYCWIVWLCITGRLSAESVSVLLNSMTVYYWEVISWVWLSVLLNSMTVYYCVLLGGYQLRLWVYCWIVWLCITGRLSAESDWVYYDCVLLYSVWLHESLYCLVSCVMGVMFISMLKFHWPCIDWVERDWKRIYSQNTCTIRVSPRF